MPPPTARRGAPRRRHALTATALCLALAIAACGTPSADDAGQALDLGTLFGGGTRRIVAAPYGEVAAAARERFVRIYPGGYFALRAEIAEDPTRPAMEVVFHEFVDYGQAFETEIRIVGLDDGQTRIEATVNRHLRRWHFRRRREDLEAAFLRAFAERLRTGAWPPMPWMKAGAKAATAPDARTAVPLAAGPSPEP